MNYWRSGPAYRASFQSNCRWVMLGLIPSSSPFDALPRMDALPLNRDPSPLRVDPDRVLEAVNQGLREMATETGVAVRLEAIEYIPNDSPYYECYFWHARKLAHWIATGVKPESPTDATSATKE